MKSLLGVVALVLSVSAVSQACTQLEAQFIGKVKEIKFESYDSSATCPLDIEEVVDQKVVSSRCDLKVGDAVSGILVNDGTTTYIE